MGKVSFRKIIIILAHAFIGWTLCASVMGIGMAVTSESNTLIIHAILAPIFFILVSLFYFRKFNYTTPLQTAIVFLSFAVFMDAFVVALLILRNTEMLRSLLGLWIPLALNFAATYITGLLTKRHTATAG